MQINKFISSSGYCSRREADRLIAQGRVMINDDVALLTSEVKDSDTVYVDFEAIKKAKVQRDLIMAFHKPPGITSTTDLKDRTNIISYINYPKRIFPIGRLDKDSEGLIFLTNNGDIVNKILRAGNEHEKEYIVTVDKKITTEFIEKMSKGITIGPATTTLPCKVKMLTNKKFSITLIQGLNRQIRRMCSTLEYKVLELQRVRIMHIQLGNIPMGKFRLLNDTELKKMYELISNSKG
jgi:23S rRNA pseudouridine2604 synthase